MARMETIRSVTGPTRDAVHALVARSTNRLGYRPLSDQLWLDLSRPDTPTIAVMWWSDGDGDADDRRLQAYAQASATPDAIVIQTVVDADGEIDADGNAGPATAALLDAALAAVDADAGAGVPSPGAVEWLVFDATDAHDTIAAAAGLAPTHAVVQMRRPLPIDGTAAPTRAFRVGVDESEWLAVNARAFPGHPQGRWTMADLLAREQEPWFDPEGFRIHEVDGRMAAFCWTKVHPDESPPAGEIYVIAVDPAFHGKGLGRGLTLAGLHSLTARGITEAMLFVDGDNDPAIGLYTSLGFRRHRVDRVYGRPVTIHR